jgi:glycosyltransferase involved in cell wall biosynthesis
MIKISQDKPLVSIVVPNFNRASIICETLDSVAKQSYSNWECIIVDDGSTDDSESVIRAYCEKDARFKYFSRNRIPKGAPTCRNIGLEKSCGEYVIFLDSDDLLASWCLEKRIQIIEQHSNNDLWVFPTVHFIFTPEDSPFRWNIMHKNIGDLARFIMHDNPWCVTGPIWRKEVISKLRGFDENALCWQDWELHIRMLINRYKYFKADDNMVDAYYRKGHQDNNHSISSKNNNTQFLNFRIQIFQDFFRLISEIGMSGEVRQAFKISFWKILQHVGNVAENVEIKKLLKYYRSINLFNRIEITLFYALFWNLGFKNKFINLLRRGMRGFLRTYKRRIYSDNRNKDSIYSKTKEINQMADDLSA